MVKVLNGEVVGGDCGEMLKKKDELFFIIISKFVLSKGRNAVGMTGQAGWEKNFPFCPTFNK